MANGAVSKWNRQIPNALRFQEGVNDMNELVIMHDKQAVTTSLVLSEAFGKQHKHVLEAISSKINSAENSAQYKKNVC